MKKTLFAAILLASITTLSAQNPQNRRSNPQGDQRQRFTPEMRAQAKTDRMKETLDLTDDQYKALYEINLQEAQERGQRPQGMRPEGGERRPETARQQPVQPQLNREELQKNTEERQQKIKEILGDEKYQRWQEETKKMQQRMQQGQRPQGQQGQRPQGQGQRPQPRR